MSDERPRTAALNETARRLPPEIAPPEDLWPRIAAGLDADAEHLAPAAMLPRAIEPAKDLWPAIERGLEPPGARGRERGFSFAAAASVGLVTVAALVSLFALQVQRSSHLRTQAPPAVAALLDGIGTSTGAAVSPSERALQSATASIVQTLTEVRRERLALERAMETDRGNADLRALWLHAYETELALANEVGQLFERYEWSLGI